MPTVFGPPVVLDPDWDWTDLVVAAELVTGKNDDEKRGAARRLIKQGGVRESGIGWMEPLADWAKVVQSDIPCDKALDPDSPLDGYWFLLSRGKQWTLGHLRLVVVAR